MDTIDDDAPLRAAMGSVRRPEPANWRTKAPAGRNWRIGSHGLGNKTERV
jgi:hypothetical protein